MADATACPRCEGCGQLANDDDKTPWSFWENLPPGSDLAVQLGIVRPEDCYECEGTGRRAVPLVRVTLADKIRAHLDEQVEAGWDQDWPEVVPAIRAVLDLEPPTDDDFEPEDEGEYRNGVLAGWHNHRNRTLQTIADELDLS